MATFHWKGRSRDGHEVSGKVDGQSKEMVVEVLRSTHITVSEITEARSFGFGEPADPDIARRSPVVPHQKQGMRPDIPTRPRRFRGLIVAAIFGFAGYGLLRFEEIPRAIPIALFVLAGLMFALVVASFYAGDKWRSDLNARMVKKLEESRKLHEE
jgi:hypothetical protein